MNGDFASFRFDMIDFLLNNFKQEGDIQSDINALDFYISSKPTELTSIVYEPSICIILQGNKEVDFGDKQFYYDCNKYLLASTHIPAKVRILQASQNEPYVSLRIKFSLEDIYEVLKETKQKRFSYSKNIEKGLFFDDLNMRLYEPISRLTLLLSKPKDEIEYMSKLIIKEILYVLISHEKSGYFISKFALDGTASNKIVNAIIEIKNSFNEKLNIKELARKIDMSESSFYQYFKTITSMSPIQFQKKLRLEEAKNMLLRQNIEASEVAFAVGYESPSQFSREYSRMFGMSPKAHREQLRQTVAC